MRRLDDSTLNLVLHLIARVRVCYHGRLLHSVAFNDAAGYVSDRYKARMVNLTSLVFGEQGLYSAAAMEKHLGNYSHISECRKLARLLG